MAASLASAADPVALAEAAYARSLADYEAYMRGPFAELVAHSMTLNVLADLAEARALPLSSKTARG